jgi:glutathione S-transferase
MITLYGLKNVTRTSRPHWTLEELAVPYEYVEINLKEKKHKTEEFLAINPNGSVPALKDDNVILFESAAICTYLADKYRSNVKLSPDMDDPLRGSYFQWLFYGAVEIDQALMKVFLHTVRLPAEKQVPSIAEEGRQKFYKCARIVEDRLKGKEFLVGNKFSVADIVMGTLVSWAGGMKLMNDFPSLKAYWSSMRERPRFKALKTE